MIMHSLNKILIILKLAFRRICNPTPPLGVPLDLQSGVKKCPNLFRLCGFAIRSKGVCFLFYWGITNPPLFIGRTLFYGGFQIRRDAWRGIVRTYGTASNFFNSLNFLICESSVVYLLMIVVSLVPSSLKVVSVIWVPSSFSVTIASNTIGFSPTDDPPVEPFVFSVILKI